jgi:hypothetical protein
MLTAALVVCFGMTFLQAVATKVINVFSWDCNTGVGLAGCCGSEAEHHPWHFHVSGCTAGWPHRPALEHRLAAADIHFCSACPSRQAAFAPALEVSLFEPEEARSKKHRYRLRPRYGGP